jgi:hypothetical protein
LSGWNEKFLFVTERFVRSSMSGKGDAAREDAFREEQNRGRAQEQDGPEHVVARWIH